MQPAHIPYAYSPVNDYDYLVAIDHDMQTAATYTPLPTFPSPEDDFDDYMNQLCEYMLY